MPVEPTPSNLLAVASYGITGRIGQLIEVHKLLDELHGPRTLDAANLGTSDLRCKTCRTSSGKPDPWPCVTWLRFAAVLDLNLGPATIALYHAIGRERNGARIRNAKQLVDAMVSEAREGEPVELVVDQPAIAGEVVDLDRRGGGEVR